jgi:hypothetical protein
MFEVKWKSGDVTWLPYEKISHLEPLMEYLEALGVKSIADLLTGQQDVDIPEEGADGLFSGSIDFQFFSDLESGQRDTYTQMSCPPSPSYFLPYTHLILCSHTHSTLMPPRTQPTLLTGDHIFIPNLSAVTYDPTEVQSWTITNHHTEPVTVYKKDDDFMLEMIHHSIALARGWTVPNLEDYLAVASIINLASPDPMKYRFTTYCDDGITPYCGKGHIAYSCMWSLDTCESDDFQLFDSELLANAGKAYPRPTTQSTQPTPASSSSDINNLFAGYSGSHIQGIVHALVKNSAHDRKRDLAIQERRARKGQKSTRREDPKLSGLFRARNAAKARHSAGRSTPAPSPSPSGSGTMET